VQISRVGTAGVAILSFGSAILTLVEFGFLRSARSFVPSGK